MTVTEHDLDALDPDHEHDDVASILYRRVTGRFRIDEWGFDRDLLTLVAPLARWRWRIDLEGADQLPEIGPALLVYTRRVGLSEPLVLGSALLTRTGRAVRAAGAPGRAPLALTARQLGGVPSDPTDLRSLLRAGEVVSWPLGRELLRPHHSPVVPLTPIEGALATGAPIVPVAMVGLETSRRWTVRLGSPLPTRRAGPADAERFAAETRRQVQSLITDLQRRRP